MPLNFNEIDYHTIIEYYGFKRSFIQDQFEIMTRINEWKTWWHSRKFYKKQNEIVVEPYHHIYYDSFPANVSSAYFDPSTFFPFSIYKEIDRANLICLIVSHISTV